MLKLSSRHFLLRFFFLFLSSNKQTCLVISSCHFKLFHSCLPRSCSVHFLVYLCTYTPPLRQNFFDLILSRITWTSQLCVLAAGIKIIKCQFFSFIVYSVILTMLGLLKFFSRFLQSQKGFGLKMGKGFSHLYVKELLRPSSFLSQGGAAPCL